MNDNTSAISAKYDIGARLEEDLLTGPYGRFAIVSWEEK